MMIVSFLVTFSITLDVTLSQGLTGPNPFPSMRRFMTLRGRRQLQSLMTAAAAGKFLMDNIKPKKGILPIPLPLPIPVPIEWEQPPVVIHPKTEIVAVPGAVKRNEGDSTKTVSSTTSTTTTTPRPRQSDR